MMSPAVAPVTSVTTPPVSEPTPVTAYSPAPAPKLSSTPFCKTAISPSAAISNVYGNATCPPVAVYWSLGVLSVV
jgi:hypothetical protein